MNLRATYSFACAAFAALVAVAGLGGCFSEHVSVTAPTGEALCTGAQPANVVRIVDFQFSPAQMNVAAGTTVTFVNCSAQSTEHSSTSDTGVWDSGLLARFATFDRTFTAVGTFPYHCTPHPFMQGTVVVQ
jgi:plastocyanin